MSVNIGGSSGTALMHILVRAFNAPYAIRIFRTPGRDIRCFSTHVGYLFLAHQIGKPHVWFKFDPLGEIGQTHNGLFFSHFSKVFFFT